MFILVMLKTTNIAKRAANIIITIDIRANELAILRGILSVFGSMAIAYRPKPANVRAVAPDTDIIVIKKFILYLNIFLREDLYLNLSFFQIKGILSKSIFLPGVGETGLNKLLAGPFNWLITNIIVIIDKIIIIKHKVIIPGDTTL